MKKKFLNFAKFKKENVKKLEEDNKKREENTLGAMESLFHSLGGEESDIENQPIIVDEQPQELVSEEEVVNVEKIDSQGGSIRCYISKKQSKIKKDNKIKLFLYNERKIGLFKLKTWIDFSKKVNL